MPSVAQVEKTCLMTLSNLLSTSYPLLPDFEEQSSQSALQTLVSNLRSSENMPALNNASDAEMLQELSSMVDTLSLDLDPSDTNLVRTLITLLSHLHGLSILHKTSPSSSHSWSSPDSSDVFETLKRQLSDFQLERLASQQSSEQFSTSTSSESHLLWSKIDSDLDVVVTMCKERTELLPRFSSDGPPQYDIGDYKLDNLPDYDAGSRYSFDDSKSEAPSSAATIISSEKMRMDLEAVTAAIDHLYLVAPQLHNQRVELNDSKLQQMQKATLQGKGKEKERDGRDLDRMFNLIDKASSRSLVDQSVVLENGMGERLKRAQERDTAKASFFFSLTF
jgi:ubiquitin-protein ligase E3 D